MGREPPLQSWVTPFGDPVVAVNARGRFMGNRGCLRDGRDEVQRFASRTGWITCALGYTERLDFPVRPVSVLTPRSTVMTITADYEPVVHPTAASAVEFVGPDPRPMRADDIGMLPMTRPAELTLPPDVWLLGEVAALSLGYKAGNMDEKWSACMEGRTLRLVRSWTGLEMFRADFEPLDGPPTMFFDDKAFSEPVGRLALRAPHSTSSR